MIYCGLLSHQHKFTDFQNKRSVIMLNGLFLLWIQLAKEEVIPWMLLQWQRSALVNVSVWYGWNKLNDLNVLAGIWTWGLTQFSATAVDYQRMWKKTCETQSTDWAASSWLTAKARWLSVYYICIIIERITCLNRTKNQHWNLFW